MAGDTINNPVELQQALQSTRVLPGDTLYLLNGTYKGIYTALISGTAEKRITIRPYPGHNPIIDGGLTIGDNTLTKGSYLNFKNLHIINSDTNRGTWATEQGTISRPTSVAIQAHHVNLINNIIHDGGVGINAYDYASNCLIYGNLVYNSGWADNVLGGAQNIYIHSADKTVLHNVFAGAFKNTISVYTTHGFIGNINMIENISFSKRSTLIGGAHGAVESAEFTGNHVIDNGQANGYTHDPNGSIVAKNNRIYSNGKIGQLFSYFPNIESTGNKIIAGGIASDGYQGQSVGFIYPTVERNYIFNNNHYHHIGPSLKFVVVEGVVDYSFAQWQALGYDLDSSYSESLPATNETFVYQNEHYDANDFRMGIVVIWNWQLDNTVSVDISTLGLVIGNNYKWRNAQDPLVDVAQFQYDGNAFVFPMTGHTVAKPIGFDEELIPNQFPLFGCFIIDKV